MVTGKSRGTAFQRPIRLGISRTSGVDKMLELIDTTTLKDSLRCARLGGMVCMTGIVGNQWYFDNFTPMEVIPTAVSLTSYAREAEDFMRMPLEELVEQIAAGVCRFRWAGSCI